jgi:hypothetical protein
VSQSIASETRWSIALEAPVSRQRTRRADARTAGRKVAGALGDAALLLLIVLLTPVLILVVGTPVALCVRLLLEIAKRM